MKFLILSEFAIIDKLNDKKTSPQIETTLNFHPSTQQVVSTSVKLQNFSGELDISRTGEIKVSSSSPLS